MFRRKPSWSKQTITRKMVLADFNRPRKGDKFTSKWLTIKINTSSQMKRAIARWRAERFL